MEADTVEVTEAVMGDMEEDDVVLDITEDMAEVPGMVAAMAEAPIQEAATEATEVREGMETKEAMEVILAAKATPTRTPKRVHNHNPSTPMRDLALSKLSSPVPALLLNLVQTLTPQIASATENNKCLLPCLK